MVSDQTIPNSTQNMLKAWWEIPISLKIKIFMWLVMHNMILTKNNLDKRGWQGDLTCLLCHKKETVTHLFLKCQVVKQIWFWLEQSQQFF